MLYLETQAGFELWGGQAINGIVHPLHIEQRWTSEELAAIGLFVPEDPGVPDGKIATSMSVQRVGENVAIVYALEDAPSPSIDPADYPLTARQSFPATQNPSSNANTLDDYEEGTWTPVMRFGGASVGVTYTTRLGQYTKVGNVCHIQGNITLSAKGSSTGAASIGGLPFAAGGPDTSWRSGINAGHMNAATWASLTAGLNLNVAGTETVISIRVPGTTGQAGNATEGNATNTSSVGFGGTYITA